MNLRTAEVLTPRFRAIFRGLKPGKFLRINNIRLETGVGLDNANKFVMVPEIFYRMS